MITMRDEILNKILKRVYKPTVNMPVAFVNIINIAKSRECYY